MINMIPENEKNKMINNIFYPYSKKEYKEYLNTLIEAGYANQLIFLKITFRYDKEITKRKETFIESIESALLKISFLNFVYGRYIENNKGGKFIMIIAVHSILGYDKTMEYGIIASIFYCKVTYLDNLPKIKKWVEYISGDYNYNNLYYYHYGARMYGLIGTRIIELFEESKFQPNRFLMLDFFSQYSNEKSVFRHLSPNIYSVRGKSPLSIINMWNVYMLVNNLRYCPGQNNIQKIIGKNEYEYFSELDYLYKNIKRIWNNIIVYFGEYFDFPINILISDYLESSIKIINTTGSAAMLLPTIDSDFTEMSIEESDSFYNFKDTNKHREAIEKFKEHIDEMEKRYKEEITFGDDHMTRRNLLLNDEEFKRKVKMNIFLRNIFYVNYD